MSFRIAAAAVTAVLLAGCAGTATPAETPNTPAAPTESKTLTVLTHDSFVLSDKVIAAFKASSGYDVKFVAPGDVGTLVNQLVLTKDAPLGDAVAPPSTNSSWPCTCAESSDARNSTALAMSSALPSRLVWVFSTSRFWPSGP